MPFPRNRLRPARPAALGALAAAMALAFGPCQAQNILPSHGVVTSGAASIGQSGGSMTVNQTSPRAIVNWGSFSIGPANGVTFSQPSASSAILNRVTGSTTSTIAGQLQANGQVYLVNPNGIAITKTGAVQTGGGFVASTLGIADSDFNKGNLNFVGNGASAGVSNAGSIAASAGRLRRPPRRHGGEFGRRLGAAGQGRDGFGRAGDAEPDRRQFSSGRRPDEHEDGRWAGADRRIRQGPRRGRIGAAQGGDGGAGDPQRGQRAGRIVGDFGARERRFDHSRRRPRRGRLGDGTTQGLGPDGRGNDRDHRPQRRLASGQARGEQRQGAGRLGHGDRNECGQPRLVFGRRLRRDGRRRHPDRRRFPRRKRPHIGADDDDRLGLDAECERDGLGRRRDGRRVVRRDDEFRRAASRRPAGPSGGEGGYVEVSASPATHGVLNFTGGADLTAPKGKTGTLLLDPFDITISGGPNSGGSFSGGAYTPTATSVINTATIDGLLGTTNVVVSTGLAGSPGTDAGNVTVSGPVTWTSANSLTLEAANRISIGDSITASGAGSSLGLTAGADIVETTLGSIAAPTLSATSSTGRVVLTAFNTVGSVSGSAPGGFSFSNSGALDVGAAGITSSGGSIALQTITGSITQTGRCAGLALYAFAGSDGTGDVILNNPNNAIGTLAGAAPGSFQFANAPGPDLRRNCELFHFVGNGHPQRRDGSGVASGVFGAPDAEIQVSTAGNLVVILPSRTSFRAG